MRLLRRMHMYAGLVLLPWLMFFGLSGIFFNHPSVGEDVRPQRVTPEELREFHGVAPVVAAELAQRVVDMLNEGDAAAYRLDTEFEPALEGVALFASDSPDGRTTLLLDLERAGGVLLTRKARVRPAGSEFEPRTLALEGATMPELEGKLRGLLDRRGFTGLAPLAAHAFIAPSLNLRVRDARGERWNLTFDTRTGRLHGRRSDSWSPVGFTQVLAKLHTTHHFPLHIGARFLWVVFEDLLGATMVFWALSGALMWWQLKATRRAGLVSLGLAFGVALVIMGGTFAELFFSDVRETLGPGE